MLRVISLCVLCVCGVAAGCGDSNRDVPDAAPGPMPGPMIDAAIDATDAGSIKLVYDFAQGDHGWQALLSDFSPAQDGTMEFESGLRGFPPEPQKTAFFVQSNNHSDDAFMLIHHKIGLADGVSPGASYRVKFAIAMASDAPRRCGGIGGAPGEGVTLKVGAVNHEPGVVLTEDLYQVTVDKGNQTVGGTDMSVSGDIANNADSSECGQHIFHAFSRVHEHDRKVTATADGDLWLLVGSDSGFEGLTQLYYQRIDVTLTPAT